MLVSCALWLSVLGCGASPSADQPPPPPPGESNGTSTSISLPTREEFIRQGLSTPELSRAAFAEALGAPDSVTAEAVPNRHIPTATDTILTLYYPELMARIHRPGPGGELPAAVAVTDNQYLRYPVIGTPVERIVESFGPPDERSDSAVTYYCTSCVAGNDPVRLFVGDRGEVHRVRFEFYVD
jgi:hypothetical protein